MASKVLISGATSGLGRALSLSFAKQHVPLVLSSRSQIKLEQLRAEIDPKLPVEIIVCDLSNSVERSHLIEEIHRLKPDLVINNAGFGLYGPALQHAISEQLDIAEVNALAPLQLTLETAKMLKTNNLKGTIVNISSAAAFFSFPEFAVYSASKAFVNQFSLALDRELSSKGIRVLTTCPGQFRTAFRARASKGHDLGKDYEGMEVDLVVEEILNQIKDESPIRIIDWKYRLGVHLAKALIPRRWLENLLRRSIQKRISHTNLYRT